jgi:hypothetical protein
VFLERTKKVGVHDNKPLSKQIEHVVVEEAINEDEFQG